MSSRSFTNFSHPHFRGGFSLTEMLVILLIIILLTTTVAFKFPSLYRNYLLSGTAQDIALTIREAQQYSVNVKASGSGERYGVFLSAPTKQMIFFLDSPSAGTQYAYDDGIDAEVKTTDFDPSLSLAFVVTPVNGAPLSPASDRIAIIFDRPNLAPLVRNQNGGVIGTLYPSVDAPFSITVAGPENSVLINISPAGTITM